MLPVTFALISWTAASWFAAGVLLGGTLVWLVSRMFSEWKLEKHARQMQSLSVQARTDSLTGLANRRVLEDEFVRRLALWREQKTPLVLVLADIDHFKQINDEHGLQAGDAALKHLASVMTSTLRQTDLVSRFGGDEFAILLTAQDPDQTAQAVARLQRALSDAPPLFDGEPLPITVSFGATSPEAGLTPSDLFRRTNLAMKAAKEQGRDRAYWHDGKSAAILAGNVPAATHN
ncbi:MAG TPA: GGDEF domain-containing protein [Pirellulaceae bacterium]|jgi:diguanylate cyclase|nr:GGDEF domain-containing protein [Pirellulaceae bacterium]